jgi:hypothetical protein
MGGVSTDINSQSWPYIEPNPRLARFLSNISAGMIDASLVALVLGSPWITVAPLSNSWKTGLIAVGSKSLFHMDIAFWNFSARIGKCRQRCSLPKHFIERLINVEDFVDTSEY